MWQGAELLAQPANRVLEGIKTDLLRQAIARPAPQAERTALHMISRRLGWLKWIEDGQAHLFLCVYICCCSIVNISSGSAVAKQHTTASLPPQHTTADHNLGKDSSCCRQPNFGDFTSGALRSRRVWKGEFASRICLHGRIS